MPSIINRAGVVPDFGEETGGDLPETEDTPVEVKSAEGKSAEVTGEAEGGKDVVKDGTGGELPPVKL